MLKIPYNYGSLPTKSELGHIIVYHEAGNRCAVVRIDGEGSVDDADGDANIRERYIYFSRYLKKTHLRIINSGECNSYIPAAVNVIHGQ